MDVKSAFLNGFKFKKVFVEYQPGFIDQTLPNHVYMLNKALYGLRQAPRAWYDGLNKFLFENDFARENMDNNLFIKKKSNELLVVHIYVDDIIFGATNENLCKEFTELMQGEFKMSLMGELNYFIGLQVK